MRHKNFDRIHVLTIWLEIKIQISIRSRGERVTCDTRLPPLRNIWHPLHTRTQTLIDDVNLLNCRISWIACCTLFHSRESLVYFPELGGFYTCTFPKVITSSFASASLQASALLSVHSILVVFITVDGLTTFTLWVHFRRFIAANSWPQCCGIS